MYLSILIQNFAQLGISLKVRLTRSIALGKAITEEMEEIAKSLSGMAYSFQTPLVSNSYFALMKSPPYRGGAVCGLGYSCIIDVYTPTMPVAK